MLNDALPPHSIEAEQATIGALFLDPELIPVIGDVLRAEMFYRTAHQATFASIQRLYAAGTEIDWVTVARDLESQGLIDTVGGIEALQSMTEFMATSASAAQWATIVRDKWRLRETITAARQVISAASEAKSNFNDVVAQWAGGLARVSDDLSSKPLDGETGTAYIDSEIRRIEAREMPKAWGTGNAVLDRIVMGYTEGSLHMVAGDTGTGKTHALFLMLQGVVEASHQRSNPIKAGIETLEMTPEELIDRQIIGAGPRIDLMGGYNPDLTMTHIRAARYHQYPVSAIMPHSLTPDAVLMGVMRLINSGCRVVAVDPLQAILWGGRDTQANIGEFINRLKQMAMRQRVAIITATQVNRPTVRGKRRPPFSFSTDDTYGHEGAFAGRAAHTISMIVRPALYDDDPVCQRLLQAVAESVPSSMRPSDLHDLQMRLVGQRLAKNRITGQLATVFWWSGHDGTLRPVADDLGRKLREAMRG